MIKFFRKIRQSLLQQGKAGKYFTYAFGEIVLVVIGILIALQINNWNEERKANIAENKALVALKKEFEQNIDRFQFILQQRDSQQLDLRAYFDIISNENTPVEEKVRVLTGGYFGGSWGAQNTVLNGLVNSGAIDNIKNDSLKSLLTYWPSLIETWRNVEDEWGHLNEKIQDYERTRIRGGIPKPLNEGDGYIFKESLEQFYKKKALFVNDLEYQNFIAAEIIQLQHQLIVGGRIMNNYEQIMNALNIEIENRNIK